MEQQEINHNREENHNIHENKYLIPAPRKLYKSYYNYIIIGVCGGIAEHLRIHPFFVRFVFVLTAVLGGWGVAAYIIASFLIPSHPAETNKRLLDKLNPQRVFGFILLITGGYFTFGDIFLFSYLNLFSGGLILSVLALFTGVFILTRVKYRTPLIKIERPAKLFRSKTDRRFLGVCGGLAVYLGGDTNVIRMLWILASFITLGIGAVVYFFTGFLIQPEKNEEKNEQ